MKVVFSRKGVDSAAGKCASALIHERPVSIPIPTMQPSPTNYGMLQNDGAELANDLSSGRLNQARTCHLDPDIDRDTLASRPEGWRGALGQVSSALSHLRNQGVGPGDLFLFWGLYRPVKNQDGRWRYTGPRLHAVFGWLAVEDIRIVEGEGADVLGDCPWLEAHPHVRSGWSGSNAVYVAAERLALAGKMFPGSGVFRKAFRLTAPGSRLASQWSVPAWLDVAAGGVGMTYHSERSWLGNGLLQAAARGQEFVADIGDQKAPQEWLATLLEAHA